VLKKAKEKKLPKKLECLKITKLEKDGKKIEIPLNFVNDALALAKIKALWIKSKQNVSKRKNNLSKDSWKL